MVKEMEQPFLLGIVLTMAVIGTLLLTGSLAWLAYDALRMVRRHS